MTALELLQCALVLAVMVFLGACVAIGVNTLVYALLGLLSSRKKKK